MRIATPDDFDLILGMVQKFVDFSGFRKFVDDEVLSETILGYLSADHHEMIVILADDDAGFIAGSVQRFPFGRGMIAAESAWWVNEEARRHGIGIKLVQAFEYWGKNVANCEMVVMTSENKSVENIYKKNGYKLYERAYMKVI